MKNIIQVFLADDHQIMIDGLRALLEGVDDIRIAGTASDGKTALESLRKIKPHILISDISMPLMDGIELARCVQEELPGVRIIALSMFGDPSQISDMLDAGASGYLLKNTGKNELVEAIRKVNDGGLYFSQEVSAEMMRTMSERAKKREEKKTVTLTGRELEIIRLIAKELSNAQIGEQLFISERTVESHRKNIFRKTDTKSVVGLIKYAMENKLI
ncbi:MAG: response regulator transcription factor [Bacteroidia bacterium]|nr:response regulator transcription factor [Bacteroidia bacterium]